MQLIGAELDSFFKVYCGFNPTDVKSIANYSEFVLSDYDDIKSQESELSFAVITIKPFENSDSTKAKQSLS